MTKIIPIPALFVGMKVAQITILEIIPGFYPKGKKKIPGVHKHKTVRCLCDCGVESIKYYASIRWHKTKSCGCLSKKTGQTHGMHKSPEYESWDGMKRRCLNKNSVDYKRYGGRGITICEKWLTFEGFIGDMGLKPNPSYTIDRINNNGNYKKLNCHWASSITQARNKRSNKLSIEKAREIRESSKKFETKWAASESLADQYNVHPKTILAVLMNRSWREEK